MQGEPALDAAGSPPGRAGAEVGDRGARCSSPGAAGAGAAIDPRAGAHDQREVGAHAPVTADAATTGDTAPAGRTHRIRLPSTRGTVAGSVARSDDARP
jgi:hypothetical protein